MSSNRKIQTNTISEPSNRLQKVISKLKTAVTNKKSPSGLNTEIDYYYKYVYPTRLEDKVEVVINNFNDDSSNRT